MGRMGRLRDWLGGQDLETRDHWMTSTNTVAVSGPFDALGPMSSTEAAFALPTVYRCVDLLSSTIAQFPIWPYRERDGVRLDERPAVFRRPDPAGTYRRFIAGTIMDMLHGEATWQVTARNPDGRALALRRLDSSIVSWRWNPNRPRTEAVALGDKVPFVSGVPGPTLGLDLIQIPMLLLPGRADGLGPLEAGMDVTAGLLQADAAVRSNYTDGVYPSGVVEIDTPMAEKAALKLKEQFAARNAGSREPVVMTGGAKFQALQMTARDSQWIEARGYGTNEIARLFGVPAAMLNIAVMGGSGTLTYQNSVSVRAQFLHLGLAPIMQRIEDAFTIAALPSTQTAEFDTSNYLNPIPETPGPQPGDPANQTVDQPVGAEADGAEPVSTVEPSRGNTEVT